MNTPSPRTPKVSIALVKAKVLSVRQAVKTVPWENNAQVEVFKITVLDMIHGKLYFDVKVKDIVDWETGIFKQKNPKYEDSTLIKIKDLVKGDFITCTMLKGKTSEPTEQWPMPISFCSAPMGITIDKTNDNWIEPIIPTYKPPPPKVTYGNSVVEDFFDS